MVKVKFFRIEAEKDINKVLREFQQDNEIISIQYIPSSVYYSLMVVYKEKEVF